MTPMRGNCDAEARAFQHHAAQRIDDGRQRQCPNQRLNGVGKTFRREENSRGDPHRQLHEVHQARDGFNRVGAAGHEQPDAGEHDGAQQNQHRHREHAAVVDDAKGDSRKAQQKQHFGHHEHQPADHQAGKKLALLHRRGEKSFEQFANPHVDRDKAQAPQSAPHQAQAEQTGDEKIDVASAGLFDFYLGNFRHVAAAAGTLQLVVDGIAGQHAGGPGWIESQFVAGRSFDGQGDQIGLARPQVNLRLIFRNNFNFEPVGMIGAD